MSKILATTYSVGTIYISSFWHTVCLPYINVIFMSLHGIDRICILVANLCTSNTKCTKHCGATLSPPDLFFNSLTTRSEIIFAAAKKQILFKVLNKLHNCILTHINYVNIFINH